MKYVIGRNADGSYQLEIAPSLHEEIARMGVFDQCTVKHGGAFYRRFDGMRHVTKPTYAPKITITAVPPALIKPIERTVNRELHVYGIHRIKFTPGGEVNRADAGDLDRLLRVMRRKDSRQ